MYQNSFSSHRSSSRGGFNSGRGSSQGGRSGGFSRGGRSGGGGRGRRPKVMDASLLTKKAAAPQAVEVYVPKHNFADFEMNDLLKNAVISRGYTEPTPIQDQTIPSLLEGRDVVGIANTGTGKTAAFLIPLINKLLQDENARALIVAPTRELAVQIREECLAFTEKMNIYALLCIGGASMFHQIKGLQRRPDIIIGTPGRLKDLNQQRRLDFSQYSTIVLDEVDRMMDMGFLPDVKFIVAQLPPERQSVFFSATLSPAIRSVMDAFLNDPVMVSVKSQETALNVDQDVVRTNGEEKINVLHDLLSQEGFNKVIVFGRTKHGIEKLSQQLYQRGFSVEALHGNKSQGQRQRALENFKSNRVTILLATDIAARGLDIADVTHVINYDLPETYEDYVHRIGRTGRANKKGVALSFID